MNKKQILILILILITGYFVFKGTYILTHNNRVENQLYSEGIKDFKIVGTKTINVNKISDEDYLTYKNIKIKNVFLDFESKEVNVPECNDCIVYSLKTDDLSNSNTQFWVGTRSDSYIERFTSNDETFDDEYFKKINRKNILKKYNVNNDIDFLKYATENVSNKNTVFTSIKTLKENYALQLFVYMMASVEQSNIYLLDGDYTGYVQHSSNGKDYIILNNNKKYIFRFRNLEYFTDEKINEIMSSVVLP